jgi:NAD(P)-dependent dehydrogenase (short-subunit alcohol dehydrogenase family)
MQLGGSVVVVTGAGGGIGGALCRRFAAEGAAGIVVADLDGQAAETVAREVGGLAVVADVTREADVSSVVDAALGAHGRIDLYCSNAGVVSRGGIDAPDGEWQRSWEVHVLAHLHAARLVLPHMLQRGRGYLLGTISAAGLLNHITALPYAVTKSAGLSFFEGLSIAYGDRGIGVSCLCPQGVRTAMLEGDGPQGFLQEGALEPEQVADAVVRGLGEERFLVLPHPEVADYFLRKAGDYDRWLAGMRSLRRRVAEDEERGQGPQP